MKSRELRVSGKSIDGDCDDDWQLVDCKKYIVHLLLPGSAASIWLFMCQYLA
jgi:ribosomal silencing factor RsfS